MQQLHLENGISAVTRDDFQMTRALMNGMVFQEQQMKHSGLRSPAAKAEGIPSEYIMEGRKGEKSRDLTVYDLDQRRLIDAEITRRSIDFMKRSVQSGKPFYAYIPFTLVHFPTLPNPKFAGKTGYGDFPDALAEMDAHVGEILDAIDDLKIRDNTIVCLQVTMA
jgi:arylsulfatase